MNMALGASRRRTLFLLGMLLCAAWAYVAAPCRLAAQDKKPAAAAEADKPATDAEKPAPATEGASNKNTEPENFLVWVHRLCDPVSVDLFRDDGWPAFLGNAA
jgi:hypothetical protein